MRLLGADIPLSPRPVTARSGNSMVNKLRNAIGTILTMGPYRLQKLEDPWADSSSPRRD